MDFVYALLPESDSQPEGISVDGTGFGGSVYTLADNAGVLRIQIRLLCVYNASVHFIGVVLQKSRRGKLTVLSPGIFSGDNFKITGKK